MKYYSLNQSLSTLEKFARANNLQNLEIIKWIVVKTLRLTISQFENIKQISQDKLSLMKDYIIRYKEGESLSKIFGYIEFYGGFFNVTENVFDPRLSSETLIDETLKIDNQYLKNAKIIDICTGSGCIAITLSRILNKTIDALDISPFALDIAKINSKKNKTKINLIKFDINNNWQPLFSKKYDIIISNPPYWNADKILNNEEVIRNNPEIGFYGGEDGLKYIKIIIENAYKYLNSKGHLLLEVDFDQIKFVKDYMKKYGFYNIKVAKDHKNIDRVVSCQKH